MQGTIDATMITGSNDIRSATLPIQSVDIKVPIPAAVPPIPLTDATARLSKTSAGSDRNIVEHAAYAKVDQVNSASSRT